mgnify:FL=1
MGPMQAAVAGDWRGVDDAFPMHYDTFPPSEIETDDWIQQVNALAPDATPHVLDGEETFVIE